MFVIPGLINAHDHLQFALHPRLANPPYDNYIDWGNDIHAQHGGEFDRYRSIPRDVRLWWGGLRNLLCGVTTVCHHDPLWPELEHSDFPVRVVADYAWAHSVALDRDHCAAHSVLSRAKTFIVHACEGADELAREEVFILDRLGVLGVNTILVHALALDEQGLALIRSRGASVILCPSSNQFLFHKLPSALLLDVVGNVALGSDSPLTSVGDLLDEVRFAIRNCAIPAEAAYRMVTTIPAAMLRLDRGEGSIRLGGVADLIAITDNGQEAAAAVAEMSMADVELVMIGGRVNLASERILGRLPCSEMVGLESLRVGGVVRWLRAPVKRLLQAAEAILGVGNMRLGGRSVSVPEHG